MGLGKAQPVVNRRHSTSKIPELKNPVLAGAEAKSLLQIAQINSLSDQSRFSETPSPPGSTGKSQILLSQPAKLTLKVKKTLARQQSADSFKEPSFEKCKQPFKKLEDSYNTG